MTLIGAQALSWLIFEMQTDIKENKAASTIVIAFLFSLRIIDWKYEMHFQSNKVSWDQYSVYTQIAGQHIWKKFEASNNSFWFTAQMPPVSSNHSCIIRSYNVFTKNSWLPYGTINIYTPWHNFLSFAHVENKHFVWFESWVMIELHAWVTTSPPCPQTHHPQPRINLSHRAKAHQKTSADDQMANSLNWDPAHFYQNDSVSASLLILYIGLTFSPYC